VTIVTCMHVSGSEEARQVHRRDDRCGPPAPPAARAGSGARPAAIAARSAAAGRLLSPLCSPLALASCCNGGGFLWLTVCDTCKSQGHVQPAARARGGRNARGKHGWRRGRSAYRAGRGAGCRESKRASAGAVARSARARLASRAGRGRAGRASAADAGKPSAVSLDAGPNGADASTAAQLSR
jgi:hypothetical protein